jgi:Cys-tRNA(Pro)/Cys-tRNA(Cys) deacylase
VFKTLLARGDRHGLCFTVIPANTELDLKALATATGDRKIELVPIKELLALTGYIRGGVTVVGAKKAFPVFADETIQLWDSISISAGIRGTQIILRPEDYLRVTEAVMADIARGK